MITYPVNRNSRFTFKLGGRTLRGRKWPREDGMPLEDAEPGLVILEETVAPAPSYDPVTHKLGSGGWTDDEAAQTATFSLSVLPLTAEEIAARAANEIYEAKNAELENAVATLRQWAEQARGTTVTQGNAVATLQTVVNRLGIFFDRFADMIEVSR